MSDVLVSVENVSKKYCRKLRLGMLYTGADVAREIVGLPLEGQRLRQGEFWAAEDVSFQVRRGECLGLIGANGAGKSTLLKMLNGIFRPDQGRIRIRGRVGALIEVGAGFHPLLTGRENIYLNGVILGMGRREIDGKIDQIVEFSGLPADVLDAPVKTYSSGMYVRLGFAVAAHADPDVLLVDEALSVGDLRFVGKCRQHISELLDGGAAVLFVTHRLHEVEILCSRAVLLRSGRVVEQGSARGVVAAYRRMAELEAERPMVKNSSSTASADGPRLGRVRLTDSSGAEAGQMRVGEWCSVAVEVLDDGDRFDGELRLWLVRVEGDVSIGTAVVPWQVVQRHREGSWFVGHLRLTALPAEYQFGVQVRGAGRFDYGDTAFSHRFEVQAENALLPFTPRYSRSLTVLDLYLGSAPADE